MSIDFRHGRWQDVLADVEADVLICDPPYSARTHAGHDSGTRHDGHHDPKYGHRKVTRGLGYLPWGETEVNEFVDHWGERVRGWICIQTDHTLAPIFSAALAMKENGGRYVFPPIPIVEIGSRVRLLGDGPSSWTHWLVVARPSTREFSRWGTLRGAYVYTGHGDREHMGGKRSDTMRDIVTDYSRPGNLIVDPCAGAATALISARAEGRRGIGCEMDRETYEKGAARIARPFTPPLLVGPAMQQTPLKL